MASNSSARNSAHLRRLLLVLVAVVAVIALAAWALWPRPIEVDAAAVTRGEMWAWVEEQGITRVPHVHQITMPIDGRVLPIELVEGDAVERGQVVAMLETDDLESALAAAEAQLARVEAQLTEAQDVRLEMTALDQINEFLISLDRTIEAAEERTRASQARHGFAADQLRRAEEAKAVGAMAATELDRRRVEAVEAEASLRSDVLTLRATMAMREAARIGPRFIHEYIEQRAHRRRQLSQERLQAQEEVSRRQRDLERASITSPASGIIFRRIVADTVALAAGSLLLEIGQLQDLEIEAEVLSEEAVRVAPGSRAEVFGGAVGESAVAATVVRIYPQGFTKVSALGIEQQRVLVVLRFGPGALDGLRERGRNLGSNFRVRVRILTDHREEVLRMPRTAVFRGPDGRWQAFIIRAGRAQIADLRLGLVTPTDVEILDGAVESDQIILSPAVEIEPGIRVHPVLRP